MLREIVAAHGFQDCIPFRVEMQEIATTSVNEPHLEAGKISNPILHLQLSYDDVFPHQGYTDTRHDNDIFQHDELHFPGGAIVRLNPGVQQRFKPRFDTLSPILKTACPSKVQNTQKRLLTAYFDRNGKVPELSTVSNEFEVVQELIKSFEETFIAEKGLFAMFQDKPIPVNVSSMEKWLQNQPPQVKRNLKSQAEEVIWQKSLNYYSYIMKSLPKPKLEPGADMKYPSPQTIAHLDKLVNAIFCPIVKEMKSRLIAVLRLDKIIYTDMSVENFQELLTKRFPPHISTKFRHILEIDISKYDKSQGIIALLFEVYIMRLLGFPEQLVATWVLMHVKARLCAPGLGFRAEVDYQRKSGDAMTFFGNTLFLMAVLAYTFDLKDCFCMFAGDDSLVFSPQKLETIGATSLMANTFNLDAKMLRFKTPYFCSKFLFQRPTGHWIVVPDFVKLVTKIGRSDLVNFEHVEEYRISVEDNTKAYSNVYNFDFIDEAICDRYNVNGRTSFSMGYAALRTIVEDPKKFSQLFFQHPNDIIDRAKVYRKLNEF